MNSTATTPGFATTLTDGAYYKIKSDHWGVYVDMVRTTSNDYVIRGSEYDYSPNFKAEYVSSTGKWRFISSSKYWTGSGYSTSSSNSQINVELVDGGSSNLFCLKFDGKSYIKFYREWVPFEYNYKPAWQSYCGSWEKWHFELQSKESPGSW